MPWVDCRKAGEFMSIKMVVNEFMAYKGLHDFNLGPNADFTPPIPKICHEPRPDQPYAEQHLCAPQAEPQGR